MSNSCPRCGEPIKANYCWGCGRERPPRPDHSSGRAFEFALGGSVVGAFAGFLFALMTIPSNGELIPAETIIVAICGAIFGVGAGVGTHLLTRNGLKFEKSPVRPRSKELQVAAVVIGGLASTRMSLYYLVNSGDHIAGWQSGWLWGSLVGGAGGTIWALVMIFRRRD